MVRVVHTCLRARRKGLTMNGRGPPEMVVSLIEQQTRSTNPLKGAATAKWLPDTIPWLNKATSEAASAPEDTVLPGEYCWVGNWKIEKKDAATDNEGFEYASRSARWAQVDRTPRPEPLWNDSVRRRVWSRTMRKEFTAGSGTSRVQIADLSRIIPRMQHGLENINKARKKIEGIMKQAPQAAQSELMLSNVLSVRKTIGDLTSILDQLERQQGNGSTHIAHIKKLKREVTKEEMAIEKALKSGSSQEEAHNWSKCTSLQRNGSGSSLVPSNSGALSLTASQSNDSLSSSCRASGSSVTSGKGAFSPSFSQLNEQQDSLDDGGYVSQTMQDRMILQKLRAVDESKVMQGIIDERTVEINTMSKKIVEVNEMFADLALMVREQQLDIDAIFNNTEDGFSKTKEAFRDILSAEKHQAAGNCVVS